MPSWYDSGFAYRACLVFTEVQGNFEGEFVVPSDWDEFWDNIQSDGDDIRVCGPDGWTLLSYEWTSFTYASRTGTIVVDGDLENLTVNHTGAVWLYWGDADAADASTASTITSADTLSVELGRPAAHVLVPSASYRPGATAPEITIQKDSGTDIPVWIRFDHIFPLRRRPYNNHLGIAGPYDIWARIEQSGSPVTSMTDLTVHRILEYDGKLYYKMNIQAGTDANDYTLIATISYTRTISAGGTSDLWSSASLRALVYVRDIDETT